LQELTSSGPLLGATECEMSGDGAEVAVSEPIRLSNRQLIGPGCVRSLGNDVSPQSIAGRACQRLARLRPFDGQFVP